MMTIAVAVRHPLTLALAAECVTRCFILAVRCNTMCRAVGSNSKEPFFVTSEVHEAVLIRFMTVMANLVADKRIVNPELSGALLLGIKCVTGIVPYLR